MSDNHEADIETEPGRRLKEQSKPFEVFWDEKASGVTLDLPDAPSRSIWLARDWSVAFRASNFKVVYSLGDLQTNGVPQLVVEAKAEIADGRVEVLGTPLRTQSIYLQLRGFDPSKASTNFESSDTNAPRSPCELQHCIDETFSKAYRKQFKGNKPTAALGFNMANEDDRYGPEEPATWYAQFDVPYETLETLIAAIKGGHCRELIVFGQFINLYCNEYATRGDFISWALLPSRANLSVADAQKHWLGDPKGGYPQAYGTFAGFRWNEHFPNAVSTPAPEPAPPPPAPQGLEMNSPKELVMIARWLPRVFWALVAIAIAVVVFA
jgi:hypothetical protein